MTIIHYQKNFYQNMRLKMNNKPVYLNTIQIEYFNLLSSKRSIVFSDDLSLIELSNIIEEIDIFWRKNMDKILFDLDYFEDKETLFLAGSMYLDLEDNKHYYFKTFGQENIVNEPILKFRNILNETVQESHDIISIFKRSFKNTLNLLEEYSTYFYILPLDYIITVYNGELLELEQDIFYQLLSSLLDCEEISSPDSFIENFNSLEEIENILNDKNINLFEYDATDKSLSLKEKLDKYESRIPFTPDNYLERFLFLLFNYWNQIIHIFITFLELDFIPYINFKESFFNFDTLFLSLYQYDDANEILNKIIMFYVFNISIEENEFNEIDFEEYVNLVKENDFQEKLMKNAEIISQGLSPMIDHITNEFNSIKTQLIKKLNNNY